MRSKRLFAMLLTFVMVFSLISPAANAVTVGEDSMNPSEVQNAEAANGSASSFDNDKVVSLDDSDNGLRVVGDQKEGELNVKVEEGSAVDAAVTEREGSWSATEVEEDLALTLTELPECLQELQEAAEVFAQDEQVVAFVVMEDEPTSASFDHINDVTAAAENALLAIQNKIIEMIEKFVLNGEELDVRYQFTYLTNSFSINTEFGHLAEIAQMEDVKSVFVMPVFQPATVEDGTADPMTESAGNMTGVSQVWQDTGYTGTGMKIAVIDTGLDLDHPSFAADPELNGNSLTKDDIDAVLKDLNAYALRGSITADTLYRSAKVPFAFNYVDASLTADHSSDSQGDHGTHVAGIAAANKVEGTSVVGMAPDAQIIVMKVFGASGGAYMDDIAAAMEDAMRLGCDVINASLGSSAGFSSSDSELDLIYERLAEQDIVANFSAGNDGTSSYGNMWGTNMNRTENPDNAAIGSPSTYANVMSIASAENAIVMSNYFAVGDLKVCYQESYQAALGYSYGFGILADYGELEFVMIDGLGNVADYYDADGNSLVEGKVAVVSRGEITYGEKVGNAQDAGALACIVYNNNDTDDIFGMYMNVTVGEDVSDCPYIPCAMISMADGLAMAEAETNVMAVATDLYGREEAAGGQMSDFSSWGVSPDLRLVPDITGIGGNVYSCYDGGGYGLMSGTSMSSPQVAGVTALVLEYLHEKFPAEAEANSGDLKELAEALLMSTADPIISSVFGSEASPRQQGAGLVNAYEAVTSEAYLTVNGGRPKAELGDSTTGVYNFTFEVHNFSDEAKTYLLDASLLTEYVETRAEYFMYGADVPLEGTVTFSADEVTVAAGGTANVNVTIELADGDKEYFANYWENGGYVEGYVYLYTMDEESNTYSKDLSLPFLGFYGAWDDAPVFDSAYWYDNSFWDAGDGIPEGDEYWHIIWTDLGGTNWVLGFNPYTGALVDENYKIIYDSAHNVVSPNNDGVLDGIDEIYLSLMRNAKEMVFTYTVDGEVVHTETFTNNRKTMYQSGYGQVVPWLYSWYGMDMYDFTDTDGNVLPSGTEVLLTIQAHIDYEGADWDSIKIPMTVDTQKPELVAVGERVQVDEETGEEQYLLEVQVSDDVALAYVALMNPAGTQIYAEGYDLTMGDAGNGNYVAWFDVTDLGTDFLVAVCDYACNERYYDVSYSSAADGNLPEVDDTKLYAYRQYDEYIQSDHMYGWISVDAENGNFDLWTDDYLEYAAINAAEYVDGYVFGVDAVGEFVVMEPGLWNRQTIASLGVNALDMTFDDATNTMLLLAKNGSSSYLYALDLMTGELEQLASYGYYSNGPYAIADDGEGTIYAIKYNNAGLYTLDSENGYALTAVVDEAESAITIADRNGSNIRPRYMQSMTIANGNLYLAYYSGSVGELITIDLADYSAKNTNYTGEAYTSDGELVSYSPNMELVGLYTMTETAYQIPEAETLTALDLGATSMFMKLGNSIKLSAAPTPWNFDLKVSDVVWTSSDETVIIVDKGTVLTVGEGTATVTATVGEVSTSCTIMVVDTATTFNAYNYYSYDGGYGYMIEVDTGKMSYTSVLDVPADFESGDYNGHDGYFYGYSSGGQLWRYNMKTGEYAKMGDPIGESPLDMSYDYSSGLMYAVSLDYNTYESTLSTVNLDNGKLTPVTDGSGMGFPMGMCMIACDGQGNMFAMDLNATLYVLMVADGVYSGGGTVFDDYLGAGYVSVFPQSMCWDYNEGVLLWANFETASIYWIDVYQGYALALGDPTGSDGFCFAGMYTVPAKIAELPVVEATSLTSQDMTMLMGATKAPNADVAPNNATNRAISWVSSNEKVVAVNNDGTVTALTEGTAVLTGTLGELTTQLTVTVIEGADNVYGHIMTDLATGGGQYWVRIYPADTTSPDALAACDYVLFAGEIVGDKLYSVGYDPNSWDANWQFFVMDADTFQILDQIDLGEGYPFVYDMTYDPLNGVMYALAGYDQAGENTDLFVMDMTTGAVTMMLATEPHFMSLAAGRDGILYAIDTSVSEEIYDDDMLDDPWATPTVVVKPASLYTIDPISGKVAEVGSTGIPSNMVASMDYDYDTDRLYWNAMYQTDMGTYQTTFAVVDPETGKAVSLGLVNALGAQVGCISIRSEEENIPAADTKNLKKVFVDPAKAVIGVDETVAISVNTIPMTLEGAEVVWSTSNDRIATVDANGVVTGHCQGKATITVTVTCNGVSDHASCSISVIDSAAAFLTWNTSDNTWSLISRTDLSVETVVATDAEAADVVTMAVVDDVIYGYDVNGQLFVMDENYVRTSIGGAQEMDADGFHLCIEAMAYDVTTQTMLVLGNGRVYDAEYDYYYYVSGNSGIYTVDLTTGELTPIYYFAEDYIMKSMAVDGNGTVYFYTHFNDTIYSFDLNTYEIATMFSLQAESLYGDAEYPQTLYYDELTGNLYLLQTGNGTFYRMVECNMANGQFADTGKIGDVVYDSDNWRYIADQYAGLLFVPASDVSVEVSDDVDMSIPEVAKVVASLADTDVSGEGIAEAVEELLEEEDCPEGCEVETYLEVEVLGVETEESEDGTIVTTLIVDITPMYEILDEDGNVQKRGELKLEGKKVTVTIPLPEGFAAEGETLYVKHLKSVYDFEVLYYHEGTVIDGCLVFDNVKGFSLFEISKSPSKDESEPEEPGWDSWFDDWFGNWWGDDEEDPTEPDVPESSETPTEPDVPETSETPTEPEEPEEPGKPGWTDWFKDWFSSWWGDDEEEPTEPETTEAPTEPDVPETSETPEEPDEDTGDNSWWKDFFSWFWPFW